VVTQSETARDAGEVAVLVNRRAGRRGDRAVRALSAVLGRAGLAGAMRPVDAKRLDEEIRTAIATGARVVGVGGGDGTMRTAADVLAGSETVLAPLPMGTLNHFARRLELGAIEAAVSALTAGKASRVPIGIADDHVFLNTATIGLYAEVVRRRNRLRRGLGKWPAAMLSSAATILRRPPVEVVLDIEGSRRRVSTPLVWVGVGRSSFPFAHEAPVQCGDPELEVVIVRPGYRLATATVFMRLILRLLRGNNPGDDPALEVIHARSLLVQAASPVGVTLDGEVFQWDAPLFIGIQADGLLVAAPNAG
jgi:diacylglycerol kinase family enzyme